MGKAKITVTGTSSKPPKKKDDGVVDLLIKVDMSQSVPKGLKSLGQSICLVHVGTKTWKKVEGIVKDDSFYIIQGELKACVSPKNVPYVEVVAFDISIKEDAVVKEQPKKEPEKKPEEKLKKENPKQIEPVQKEVKTQEAQPPKEQSNTPKKKKNNFKGRMTKFVEWYKPEEIIYISYHELILTEDEHLKAKELWLNGVFKAVNEKKEIRSPMAVRPINGKYALVMGMKHFIVAKIFEMDNVPVVVRDMSYDEFLEKYCEK